ncbi:MAG: phosphotransferase [Lautropia sp.]|nr:phosphotransferase [Lautropia sp.]
MTKAASLPPGSEPKTARAATSTLPVDLRQPPGAAVSSPPELPGHADDIDTMQPLLRAALPAEARDARLVEIRCLRHKPGKRALLQYRLQQAGHPDLLLIGKLRFKGADRHGFEVQRALYAQGFDMPGLSVPEALTLLPEQRLWLQRQVPGTMATSLLRPGSDVALATRIGQAIASLHRAGVPTAKRWTLADEMTMLEDRLLRAASLRPGLATEIFAVLDGCTRLAARLPANPFCGIHRDCYSDQILVDGDTLCWLDLDLYCEGDPALDAGNFIAHLTESAFRHQQDPLAMQAHEHAVQAAFIEHGTHRIPTESVAAWTTLSLARHVFLSTQFPDRHHTTEALIAHCLTRLSAF